MENKPEDINNFNSVNFHIDEEMARTQAIRDSNRWAMISRTFIMFGIGAILFAIALFILMRIFVPQKNLLHTQQAIAQQVEKSIKSDIEKIVAGTAKSSIKEAVKGVALETAEQTSKKIKDDAVSAATEAATEATEKAMKETLPDIIKETVQKTVDNSVEKLEAVAENTAKQAFEKSKAETKNIAEKEAKKTVQAETERQQKESNKILEKIREKIIHTKSKDIVTNYTIYFKKTLQKKGFKQVVSSWDYNSSQDKEPSMKRCFMGQSGRTISLANLKKGEIIPVTKFDINKEHYEKFNIDESFENEARKLCNF